MLKFLVVIYKRPGMSGEEFRHLTQLHGPLADRLTGGRRYVRHPVRADPKRNSPGWNAVIELSFDHWGAMEVAWASPEGAAELTRTTWSVAR